jgi:hypothetical protein
MMKTTAFLLCLVSVLILGCVPTGTTPCDDYGRNFSVLSPIESNKLKQIELDNEFVSGCVTEAISDIGEELCLKCQGDCRSGLESELSYSQWLKIYDLCMVK